MFTNERTEPQLSDAVLNDFLNLHLPLLHHCRSLKHSDCDPVMSQQALPPPRGIYTPLVTFFRPDSSLDLDAIRSHALRIAQGGVAGLVLQGSNGEAVHLDNKEREAIIRTVREHLDDNQYKSLPLIIGCGLPSARATIKLTHEAKAAGGDFALVLPPSYWPGAMSKPVLVKFFEEVADQSPLPVLIYNFPLVANGINIDSDTMILLSQHNNIVGCKLTCGVRTLLELSSFSCC